MSVVLPRLAQACKHQGLAQPDVLTVLHQVHGEVGGILVTAHPLGHGLVRADELAEPLVNPLAAFLVHALRVGLQAGQVLA